MLFLLFICSICLSKYEEEWRPQYHFTPPNHWMNDPNGLSWFKGYYHMFFQYNSAGIVIGNQSWAHAVSVDLVDWEYKGIAIPRREKSFIFSGCAVVFNESLNAIYTVYHETEQGIIEDEYLSVSKDGFKFVDYPMNPILTHHTNQLQDPKVLRYNGNLSYFVMAISIPDERMIQFYRSNDLTAWDYLSEFGHEGSVEYHWEMPVLSKVLSKEGNEEIYILIVNVGYYSQYFFGSFNGIKFVPFEKKPKIRLMDYGPDFFETQTFYQSKEIGDRVILIANVVNYHYALNLPTKIWRNTQSLPRELRYTKIKDEYHLIQEPVHELKNLRTGEMKDFRDLVVLPNEEKLFEIEFSKTMEIEVDIICKEVREGDEVDCGFEIFVHTFNSTNQKTIIGYNNNRHQTVYIDRKYSGVNNFSDYYRDHTRYDTPQLDNGINRLRIFVDWSTVEVFVNQMYTITAVVFPEHYSNYVFLKNSGTKDLMIESIKFRELRSIHKK